MLHLEKQLSQKEKPDFMKAAKILAAKIRRPASSAHRRSILFCFFFYRLIMAFKLSIYLEFEGAIK